MRDKRKTLDKTIDNVKLNKVVKKQKLQEQGITLIALVVTIIILLILAGVTLNIALSDNGLFGKAKKAAEEYKEAQNQEEDAIRQIATPMYSEYVGATIEGYNLENNKTKSVTIKGKTSGLEDNKKDDQGNVFEGIEENGDQKFTTNIDMNWRVWDFDGNTLRIIGELAGKEIALKGAAGYNNVVWAIDYICKELYSNGKKGVSATSLKRTDIQKVSTYDYTKYKLDYKEDETEGKINTIYFGESRTYDIANKYPDMWDINDKYWTYEYENKNKKATGEDKECRIWEKIVTEDGIMGNKMIEGSKETRFKESYYYHSYNRNEFINDKYYDLIFKKTDGNDIGFYILANRYVRLYPERCGFGITSIGEWFGSYTVGGFYICYSDRRRNTINICFSSYSVY